MKIAAVLLSFLATFQILGHGFGPDTYVKIFSNGNEGWQTISQIHTSKKKYLQVKTYDSNLFNPTFDRIKFSGKSKTNCYFEIDFGTGQHNVIKCAPTQSFYLFDVGRWVQACELTPGDYLFRDGSDGKGNWIQIKSIEFVNQSLDIYTLEVDCTHTFLVGFDSVLTHNISLLFSLSIAFGEGAIAGGEIGSYCGPITAGIGLGVGGLIGVGISYYKYKRRKKINYNVSFNPNEVQRVFYRGLERSKSKKKLSGGGSNKKPDEDKKKKRVALPTQKKKDENYTKTEIHKDKISHIFDDRGGHIIDTPENRKLLIDMSSDNSNFLGEDKWGNRWFGKVQSDGKQLWASVRGKYIRNCGINDIVRIFNENTGLCNGI